MKISPRQRISILFLFFIIFLLVPATSLTVNSAKADISVESYDDLLAAIGTAPTNGAAYTIKITDNITLTGQLMIPGGKNITITSDMAQSGAPFTLTQAATTTAGYYGARHFYLNTGTTLILENVILSGIGSTSDFNGGIYINYNSNLIMNDGAAIRNCYGGINGGGIYVNSGTLTMNNGEISGNTASTNGGGIYMGFGSLTMNGGTISNNKAISNIAGNSTSGGGMYAIFSTFTMTAGKINGNEATSSGSGANSYGGGVYLSASIFNMGVAGGSNGSVSITNNTADYMGGGIFAVSDTFTMYCGTISGNKAFSGNESTYGGGVELYRGTTFTMKDGIISANTSNDFSGGVEVYDHSVFNMDGGSIIDNTAPRGGGISIGYNSATFNMNGGVVSGNTSANVGGGTYVYSSGVIAITSGIISGNSAPYGGGIFTDDTGTVNVDNCTIADNTATASDSGGGGIYTEDTTYANLTTGGSTVFAGNLAATDYIPSGNLDVRYPNIRYAAVTDPFAHPLNNYDINTTFNIALTCHITFDSQGGTGIPDQFKNFGETVDRPDDPTKSGYAFYGWWTKNASGEWDYKWDFDTVLVLETHSTELVLYARWDEPLITVSGTVSGLLDNSGITIDYSTNGDAAPHSTETDGNGNYRFTVAYDSDVIITPPIFPEYSVNPKSISLENLTADSANNDFTYTPNTYSVTYNPGSGQGTAYEVRETVGTNHIILDNMDTNLGFTKNNDTFIGWNTQADGNGIAYNPGDTLTALAEAETVTLYAMWQEDITTNDTDNAESDTAPSTGDRSNLFFWIVTGLSALLIIVSLRKYSRKSFFK